MGHPRPRRDPRRPAWRAIASSTTAARTTRAQATNTGGTPSSTAILMNRYGMPHSAVISARWVHARALTGRRRSSAAGRAGGALAAALAQEALELARQHV